MGLLKIGPFRKIDVKAVSFGPEGSDGSTFLLGANISVRVDQMAADKSAVEIELDLTLTLELGGKGWEVLKADFVTVRVVLKNDRTCVFPKCLHSEDGPYIKFFAQDIPITNESVVGKTYWAVVDGQRIIDNTKIDNFG